MESNTQDEATCGYCHRTRLPWPAQFIGKKGKPVKRCLRCQIYLQRWELMQDVDEVAAKAAQP